MIKGISSKLIPKMFIPKFGGIISEKDIANPIVFAFKLTNFNFLFTVGPAGLEPATDGL